LGFLLATDSETLTHVLGIVYRTISGHALKKARLAALVPSRRVHLTRYHGVFAPHATLRAAITPAGHGRGTKAKNAACEPPKAKHVSMTWAQRLKRVFAIDIERCRRCGGRLRVIASIEAPALIERILAHLEQRAAEDTSIRAHRSPRAHRRSPRSSEIHLRARTHQRHFFQTAERPCGCASRSSAQRISGARDAKRLRSGLEPRPTRRHPALRARLLTARGLVALYGTLDQMPINALCASAAASRSHHLNTRCTVGGLDARARASSLCAKCSALPMHHAENAVKARCLAVGTLDALCGSRSIEAPDKDVRAFTS
jgi:hypothetical protein